ncbi:exocyst complex component EXO70E2-like [Andrographis paniculata]|uniref:exocyst complex component EXO70E2-like n=1 Tax=Andrographis paniculata TaxID=175694 RepID=UPI0021E77475|nr:exocyst complex component EXO70E2-like [Andrographis paniculata]
MDGEEHVIAAAYHLLMAVEATNNFSDDVRKLVSDLNTRLSQLVNLSAAEVRNLREIESRIAAAQETILAVHSAHPRIWESYPLTASQYLHAVDEIGRSISILETTPLSRGSRSKELFDGAQTVLQAAMARLQDEVVHILVENKRCFGHGGGGVPPRAESFISNDDNESSSTDADEDANVTLIHPDVVPKIKSIADTMFRSGYGREFCRVFTSFWQETLSEYLTALNVEQVSVEDVVRMEWKRLNVRIKLWRTAIKKIVAVYLVSTKHLFDQILAEHKHEHEYHSNASLSALTEASKAPFRSLLNFGEAVVVGPHRPEHLFCLLDMYEALATVAPDVDALFPEDTGSFSRVEFHELLIKLRDAAFVVFEDFGNHIASPLLPKPYKNGGIHPLTKYVMNYIIHIGEYDEILNSLLRPPNSEGLSNDFGARLRSFVSTLESNLHKKSNSYKEGPLKHIFLMNNIHYIVHKIKNSKTHPYFGDVFIRQRTVAYRQHAKLYKQQTWCSIVDLFSEANKVGKAMLKQRCLAFAAAFEDVYKNQTRWCVPDGELRNELTILVSKDLILGYRNFVKVVNDTIGEKHVKFSENDVAMYILDLFEGTPKSINHPRKK